VTDDTSGSSSSEGVTSGIDAARERVEHEQERTADKQRALDQFDEAVREIEPDEQPSGGSAGIHGGGGGGMRGDGLGSSGAAAGSASSSQSSTGGGCRAVRRAFAEYVQPYSGDAGETHDSVHEAIAAEFSNEVAVSLASADAGGWLTPQLKQGIISETNRRRAELSVMDTALQREQTSLASAMESQRAVVDWLVEHNPTPLSELSFDELAAWHHRLDDLRDQLDAAADERQAHLDGVSGESGQVGIKHEVLAEYLYAEFEATHPALSTFARLDELCAEAQATIREHLTRRV
jgi:hypothetical protein